MVARFGVFLREEAAPAGGGVAESRSGTSLYVGLGLIAAGVLVCMVSAVRHTRYVRAIDQGRFRASFGSRFAFGLVALLSLVGVAMAVLLVRL